MRMRTTPSTCDAGERLASLAHHRSASIRWCVAVSPSAPPEVLTMLARDDHSAVREAALENLRSRGI